MEWAGLPHTQRDVPASVVSDSNGDGDCNIGPSETNPIDWASIPLDVLNHIALYCTTSGDDARSARLVCSRWAKIITLPSITISSELVPLINNLRLSRSVRAMQICEEDTVNFVDSVCKNSFITSLSLRNASIMMETAERICSALSSNQHYLTELSLNSNDLDEDSICFLIAALQQRTSITRLSLGANPIGSESATIISAVSSLSKLNLRATSLDGDGAALLAEALKANGTLLDLDLRENSIDTPGAETLAAVLSQQNKTLKRLVLRVNVLYGSGAALGHMLMLNRTLTQLDLSFTLLGPQDCSVLMAALKHNSTLRQLKLIRNNLVPSNAIDIYEALEENATLTDLRLGRNEFCEPGAETLAKLLRTNHTIKRIDLRSNFFGARGIDLILDALAENTTVATVDLRFDSLKPAALATHKHASLSSRLIL